MKQLRNRLCMFLFSKSGMWIAYTVALILLGTTYMLYIIYFSDWKALVAEVSDYYNNIYSLTLTQ